MLYTYQFHPFAQEEYEDSISWYAIRSTKIAEDFVNSIDKEITKICKSPQINKNEVK